MIERKSLSQTLIDIKLAAKWAMRIYRGKDTNNDLNQSSIPSTIMSILKQNDVPIAYLSDKILDQADHNKYILWKDEFKKVKDIFINNGIKYIFIKTPSFFPYTSGNLDILVREEDFSKAGKLLKDNGFVELKNAREPHKWLYKKFDCGKEVIPIHLHERVFWGATFLDNELIWKECPGRLYDEVVYTLAPEDCLLTTLAHSFYENAGVRLSDLSIVKHLIESKKIDWNRLNDIPRRYQWTDGFYSSLLIYEYLHERIFKNDLFPSGIMQEAKNFIIRNSFLKRNLPKVLRTRVSMPFYIPVKLSKMLHYKKILRSNEFGEGKILKVLTLSKGIIDGICRNYLSIEFQRQKPILVAFSGFDGSGKTSYATALNRAFENCGLKTEYMWTRVGSTRISKLASSVHKKVFRKYEFGSKSKCSVSPYNDFIRRENIFRKKWVSTLWHIMNILDFCIFYNFKVRKALFSGKVVICDRYIPDILADMYVHTPNKKSDLTLKILSVLLPKPDIGILLKVHPEVAHKRAKEKDYIEYLYRQNNLYGQVSEELQLKKINAEGEFRDTCNMLVKEILENYYSR